MTRTIFVSIVLAACSPKESEPTCDATLVSTFPAEGATDAYVRTTVEFTVTDHCVRHVSQRHQQVKDARERA